MYQDRYCWRRLEPLLLPLHFCSRWIQYDALLHWYVIMTNSITTSSSESWHPSQRLSERSASSNDLLLYVWVSSSRKDENSSQVKKKNGIWEFSKSGWFQMKVNEWFGFRFRSLSIIVSIDEWSSFSISGVIFPLIIYWMFSKLINLDWYLKPGYWFSSHLTI